MYYQALEFEDDEAWLPSPQSFQQSFIKEDALNHIEIEK